MARMTTCPDVEEDRADAMTPDCRSSRQRRDDDRMAPAVSRDKSSQRPNRGSSFNHASSSGGPTGYTQAVDTSTKTGQLLGCCSCKSYALCLLPQWYREGEDNVIVPE
jgi:hypothetical protein